MSGLEQVKDWFRSDWVLGWFLLVPPSQVRLVTVWHVHRGISWQHVHRGVGMHCTAGAISQGQRGVRGTTQPSYLLAD